MDKTLVERYKREMLEMYRAKTARHLEEAVPTVAKAGPSVASAVSAPVAAEPDISAELPPQTDGTGFLVGIASALRSLYPIENAEVTVFTGSPDSMNVITVVRTDRSGRTAAVKLSAPPVSLSQFSGAEAEPYSKYNMLVRAEGYVDNIHLNIPVFSGVTSVQRSDMLLIETADGNRSPQIFDEDERYNL